MADSVGVRDALNSIIEEAALAYAHKWRLVADDGVIWCATDNCQHHALLPSLHCGSCLGAHYARFHITQPYCINREQQPTERKVANGE